MGRALVLAAGAGREACSTTTRSEQQGETCTAAAWPGSSSTARPTICRAAQVLERRPRAAPAGAEGDNYLRLDASGRDLVVEVQQVPHDSRVHLDIESDDVEAEVARLQKLGARRLDNIKTWVVLEAPTGQRFCVVRAKTDLRERPGVSVWE